MSFTASQIEQLQAPLDGSQVKTRDQAGRSLSYIEGWAAIDTANRIFGHGEWGYIVSELTHVGTREVHNARTNRDGWEVGYRSRVIVALTGGTTYEDVGFGSGTDYNSPFAAHESAGKEAVTDALKRALKNLGYPFGLALYDKTQEHVEYDNAPARPSTPARPAASPQQQSTGTKEASDKQKKMLFAIATKADMVDVVDTVVSTIKLENGGVVPMSWMNLRLTEISDKESPSDWSYFRKAHEAILRDRDADMKKGQAKEPDGSEGFTPEDVASQFDAMLTADPETDIPW